MAELNQHPPVQHAGWMIGEEHQTLFHFSPVPQLTTVVSYELAMHMYLPSKEPPNALPTYIVSMYMPLCTYL
jgi:hypothetical protein